MKRVVIGCEVNSLPLKEAVKAHLIQLGYEVADLGQQAGGEPVLYYTAARRVAPRPFRGEMRSGELSSVPPAPASA